MNRQSTMRGVRRGGVRWGVLLAALCAVLVVGASLGAGCGRAEEIPMQPGPPQSAPGAATLYAKAHPGVAPPGTNDFSCRPTAAHPQPVVLMHGSDGSAYADWSGLTPKLKTAGYCVFALNYGQRPDTQHFGMIDMRVSAHELSDFVDQARHATGAGKVDIVAVSQGATVSRYYIDRLGGDRYVDQWIGLASPTYGGTFYGLGTAVASMPGGDRFISDMESPALEQQVQGSAFLRSLNADGDTVPGVHYTTIGTRYDEVIQPYTNVALRDPGARNILIQNLCPADETGHFNMPFDPFVQQLVLNVLDPADATPPVCRPVPLGTNILGVLVAGNS